MLSVWRPFGVPASSLRALDRDFERFFNDGPRAFDAPAEVVESEQGLMVQVDLPGVADADLQVTIESNLLTVKASRRNGAGEGSARHLTERSYGTATRTFRLPPWADGAGASAKLDRGVLTIALPRKAESRPRTIDVKVNQGS